MISYCKQIAKCPVIVSHSVIMASVSGKTADLHTPGATNPPRFLAQDEDPDSNAGTYVYIRVTTAEAALDQYRDCDLGGQLTPSMWHSDMPLDALCRQPTALCLTSMTARAASVLPFDTAPK
jgi:hypothetical protein